jgi:hypothetical protein
MGVLLFILCSLVVGARLMFVYARLKQPPELFLGLAYLLAGTLGWGGLLVGALKTPPGERVPEAYQAWSVVFGDAGTLCFYLFIWYVFRRQSAIAKGLVALAALAFAVSLVKDTWLTGVTFGPPPGTATTVCGSIGRMVVFPWMAFEAFTQYFAFRRRARIGLGNPLVANRLLLWALSAVAMFAISATSTALYWTAIDAADATAKVNRAGGAYGVLALLSSLALWLAFFPPKAYTGWVESAKESSRG